jgi:hypothetical protein
LTIPPLEKRVVSARVVWLGTFGVAAVVDGMAADAQALLAGRLSSSGKSRAQSSSIIS